MAVVCPEKADGRQVPSVAMISTGVLMSALHLGSIEGQTRAAARTFEGAHGVTSGAWIEPERGVEPMRTPTAPGMTLDGPDAQLRSEQRDGSVDAVRAATSRAAATPMPTSEPVDARLEAASRASATVTYGARSRGTSPAVGPAAPAAVLIILLRDPDTGTLLSLGLSSGPDVGARVQRSDGEVWATLGPSLPIPPAPPAPPQALGALEFRDVQPSSLTGARITPWLTGPGAAPLVFGGLIDARAEAATRGPACGDVCEVLVRPGMVVLARGLGEGRAHQVAASLGAQAADPAGALMGVAGRAEQLWPGGIGVRSMSYARDDPGVVLDERIEVRDHGRGRAHRTLQREHLRFLGDERIPALLAAAAVATDAARDALLQQAIVLGRQVTRAYPTSARWTANLALAYALAQPKDDRAVLHLEEALRRGRQDPEVLATAAAVRATRGEIARARDLYTRAYAATRGAGPRARIREKMAALEEVAP